VGDAEPGPVGAGGAEADVVEPFVPPLVGVVLGEVVLELGAVVLAGALDVVRWAGTVFAGGGAVVVVDTGWVDELGAPEVGGAVVEVAAAVEVEVDAPMVEVEVSGAVVVDAPVSELGLGTSVAVVDVVAGGPVVPVVVGLANAAPAPQAAAK